MSVIPCEKNRDLPERLRNFADTDDVREAIKKIMEGSEKAFNLRKEKYGF